LRREAEALLGATEAAVFLTRVQRHLLDLFVPLERVYGAQAESLVGRVVRLALDAAATRPSELRLLDRRREVDPVWFQRARMQGYVCYTERFCVTLAQLPSRVDYLAELGVTYLHLMPLLRPRPGRTTVATPSSTSVARTRRWAPWPSSALWPSRCEAVRSAGASTWC